MLAEAEHRELAGARVEDDTRVILRLGDHPRRLLARRVHTQCAVGDLEVPEGGPARDETDVEPQASAAARQRPRAREWRRTRLD